MVAASELHACLHTGRDADADGLCLDHGVRDCVLTVEVPQLLFECVIPGFQCTHLDHIRPVRWPPIPKQRRPE